jgi:putative ABC transport system permease protein
MNDMQPPKWATRLLRAYCRQDLLEDLEGDLHESYMRSLSRSKWYADLTYILDVAKFFRPCLIKKPNPMKFFSDFSMGRSFVKTLIRNLGVDKLFSSINILGLSVSMAVGLIIIALLHELSGFDRFHDGRERMYRVNSTYISSNDGETEFAIRTYTAARQNPVETLKHE